MLWYECPCCGTEYPSKAQKDECELSHYHPESFEGYVFSPMERYPEEIEILMEDGESVRYRIIG